MFAAIEFLPEQENIAGFEQYLLRLQFPHRLSEQEGKVVLWVFEREHVSIAQELYERFRINPMSGFDDEPVPVRPASMSRYPVTLLLLLASLGGFLLFVFQYIEGLSLLSFQGLQVAGDRLLANTPDDVGRLLQQGQIWRLLTPVFLHFDLMHVVFNATILWFLGSQIEKLEGSGKLLAYVVFVGVVSNLVQYQHSPANLFGGMSGVNYGLLAYCYVINLRYGKSFFFLPGGFFWMSVLMMVLGFLNVFSLFGYAIANWAHLAGFVAGALLVPVFHYNSKLSRAE